MRYASIAMFLLLSCSCDTTDVPVIQGTAENPVTVTYESIVSVPMLPDAQYRNSELVQDSRLPTFPARHQAGLPSFPRPIKYTESVSRDNEQRPQAISNNLKYLPPIPKLPDAADKAPEDSKTIPSYDRERGGNPVLPNERHRGNPRKDPYYIIPETDRENSGQGRQGGQGANPASGAITKDKQSRTLTGMREEMVISSLTLHEGRVYVGMRNGNFCCFDGVTGKELWEFEARGICTHRPAIADGRIYLASGNKLYAMDMTGRLFWFDELGSESGTGPLVSGDRLVIIGDDGNIICIELQGGRRLWSFTMDAPVSSKPTIFGDIVTAKDRNNKIYAISMKDGRLVIGS